MPADREPAGERQSPCRGTAATMARHGCKLPRPSAYDFTNLHWKRAVPYALRNGSENRFLRQVGGELADFPEESPRVVGSEIETEPPGLSFEKHSIRQPDAGCHRGPSDSSDEHALLPVGHNEVRPRIEPAPRSVTNVESCR